MKRQNSIYTPLFHFEENFEEEILFSLAKWMNGKTFKPSDYKIKGLPIIKIAEIKNGISNQTKFSDIQKKEPYLIKKNDFLFSWSGQPETSIDIFRFAHDEGLLNQHIYKVDPLEKKITKDYFFYLMKYLNKTFIKIAGNKQTTGLGHVTRKDLENIIVKFPSNKDEQDSITSILKSIDNKIELNKKNNQTLEEIGKAVFKSWFIDFDPVRAKVEGRSTKLPDEMSNLFPDSFTNTDFGEIPKGWEFKNLTNIFDFLEGPGIRNWQYTNNEKGIRFINIRCINSGDLNLATSNRITEEEALGKYKHFGLLENDIVVSTSGTLGKYAIVRKEHLPLNLNTSVIRFRPIDNKSTFSFLYGFIENQFQHELEIRASGSVQRNFGPMHLREIELLLPDINLLKVHEEYVSDLFIKRKLNLGENHLLSNLRDTLLPKLISGALSIPDAERMLEEANI